MKQTLIFAIFVIIIVAFLYSISGSKAPQIPNNDTHKGLDINDSAVCMECHGPGKPSVRKPNHPPKDECYKCHKVKRVVKKD